MILGTKVAQKYRIPVSLPMTQGYDTFVLKKRAVCFVSLIGVYNFARTKRKNKQRLYATAGPHYY